MYYAGTVLLGRSEEDFWKMYPRQIHSLIRIHGDINNPDDKKKKAPSGFIDQVIF